MKCTHCGTEAYDYQTICLNCGNRLAKIETIVDEEITQVKVVKKISPEKKLTVLVLAIAFGYVGAHCFYLDEKRKGIFRLLLFLFAFPVASILNIIDVVKILFNKYTVCVKK